MEELTEDRPKPMIPLRGKPMLEHILDRLREAGFKQALLVTGYKAETIEDHFRAYPMEIEYRRQETIDGTARAALLGREFAAADPCLLTFGDILTEAADYRAMAAKMTPETEAVLAAKWVDDPWQGAAIYADESGRVSHIVEKPPIGTSTTHWNSAGAYCFRESAFAEMARVPRSPRGEYEITSAVEQLIDRGLRVLVHGLEGAWRDVGRPGDIAVAEDLLGG